MNTSASPWLRLILLGFVLAVLTVPLPSGAQSSQTTPEPPKRQSVLEVDLWATKQVYQVHEPISFHVKPNRNVFVYLFQATEKAEQPLMLFPNRDEPNNQVPADRELIIPARASFRGNEPGVEKVVLVASTEELDLKTTLADEAVFPSINRHVLGSLLLHIQEGRKKSFSRLFRSSRSSKTEGEQIAKELEVVVKGGENGPYPIGMIREGIIKPVLLAATDKIAYKVMDTIIISYAASTYGHVALYYIDPQRNLKLIRKSTVTSGEIYRVDALASSIRGRYFLLGVFSGKDLEDGIVQSFAKDILDQQQSPLGIPLLTEPDAYALYPFIIY